MSKESIYSTIIGIVRDQIGKQHEKYIPFIYSVFCFVLVSCLIGNIPYSYTTTTSIITSLGLSIVIWISVTILAINLHGIHFFSFFVPGGTPLALAPVLVLIELVSYIARSISLGLRTWANITAGHTLLKILATFLIKLFSASFLVAIVTLIPFAIFVALIGLEIAVSFIQAYVFVTLVSSYLKDAIELH